MAKFNLTTTPTSLNIEPGQTKSIVVVVSNRLGRPFLARVAAKVTPASAASWVGAPANAVTQFKADPAATETMEFTVTVPADAKPQSVQFRADVADAGAPDDPLEQGETVGIEVMEKAPVPAPAIPWWVWVIVGVVVVGAGVGIWLAVRPTGVPNVVTKTMEEATTKLQRAGFDSVAVRDSLLDTPDASELGTVVAQDPEAGSDIPESDPAIALIVVIREATTVPPIVGRPVSVGIPRLTQARLRLGVDTYHYTGTQTQDDQVKSTNPVAGTRVAVDSPVHVTIYSYREQRPCPRNEICILDRAELSIKYGEIMDRARRFSVPRRP